MLFRNTICRWVTIIVRCSNRRLWTETVCVLITPQNQFFHWHWLRPRFECSCVCKQTGFAVNDRRCPPWHQLAPLQKYPRTAESLRLKVESVPPELVWPLLWVNAGNTSWLSWSHRCATRPPRLLAKVPQQQKVSVLAREEDAYRTHSPTYYSVLPSS